MHIIAGIIVFIVVTVISLSIPEISSALSQIDTSLKATLFVALIGLSGVLYSQWRFDERQRELHKHDLKTKERERKQDKAEELISIFEDIKDITARTKVKTIIYFVDNNNQVEKAEEIQGYILRTQGLLYKSIGIVQMNFLTPEAILETVCDSYQLFKDEITLSEEYSSNGIVDLSERISSTHSKLEDALISLADSVKLEVMSLLDKTD